MPFFTRHWFVACIALLLLGASLPQVSGQQRACLRCADQCQGENRHAGSPADPSHHDDSGDGCDQCLVCHPSTAQLPSALTLREVAWTQTRVAFIEWKGAFYGTPLSEIDYPPQLS